ncbi:MULTISPECIES: hypothetical protein [unclassified Nocardiopsis]|uniref:hypothetical protein n=1 Tax=unclassified Nocardiopsis TaxID=2649073 RepID=UPI0033E30288
MSAATTAHAGYSHLFPGARVFVATTARTPGGLSGEFPLVFSDGSRSTARLLGEDERSRVLAVDGYTTAKGTRIDERVWAVRAVESSAEGMGLSLGSRLPA